MYFVDKILNNVKSKIVKRGLLITQPFFCEQLKGQFSNQR